MKPALCTALIFTLASVLVARQINSPASADENRIVALENAWNSAEQQKNTKALDELLSNTLVYTDYDGTFMNKSEFLASVSNPALRPETIANDSLTVHTYGSSAIATGVFREKGTLNGKGYSRRIRFTDTWVSENGVWHCVAGQSTLLTRQ